VPAPRLILASSSPRRKELLTTLGVDFCAIPADIDESVHVGETPRDYVSRMAVEKAAAIARVQQSESYVILAADTTVVLAGEILGKPTSHGDAMAILSRLSGRHHSVITAVCLQTPTDLSQQLVETQVAFITLSAEDCEAYLSTDEPWDKAGAYAIQGLGGAFVQAIDGSYSNVVGLPLAQTWKLLREHGIPTSLSGA